MPALALDFISKRLSTLAGSGVYFASQSYSRSLAAGSSTCLGYSRVTWRGVGAAAGVGAAVGVGRALAAFGAGVSAGAASAAAVGTSFSRLGAGSAAGAASAAAVGRSTHAAAGAAAGIALVASSVGSAPGVGVGLASGAATAQAVVYAPGRTVGTAAGVATAAAVGRSFGAWGTGAAAGAASVSGVGNSLAVTAGTSDGAATVVGVGNSLSASAAGTSAGVATAVGVGGSLAASAAGTSVGAATVVGAIRALRFGVGASAGEATAVGAIRALRFGVGSAAGTSTATSQPRNMVGAAAGVATVSGAGLAVETVVPLAKFFAVPVVMHGGQALALVQGRDTQGGWQLTEYWGSSDSGQTWARLYRGESVPFMPGKTVSLGAAWAYYEGTFSTILGTYVYDTAATVGASGANFTARQTVSSRDGTPVAVGSFFVAGGTGYVMGFDSTSYVSTRRWALFTTTDGWNLTFVGEVTRDPTDPALATDLQGFEMSGAAEVNWPMGGAVYRNLAFKKYGSRWFALGGNRSSLFYSDAASGATGWRKVPLDISDGDTFFTGVMGLEQVGSKLVAWGPGA